jgi:proline iminopeptidase
MSSLMRASLRWAVVAIFTGVFFSPPAAAQDLSLGLAPGGTMRLGTKITLKVNAPGRDYRFVGAVINREGGVTYEWFTTFPETAVGYRILGDELLATSRAFCACHRRWEYGPATDATSLWMSRAVFEDLVESGEADFRFNPETIELRDAHLTFVGNETLDVLVNGVDQPLPAMVAVTDEGAMFWIHDDPTDPLILRVQGPWSSRVTAILQRPDSRIGTVRRINNYGLHAIDHGEGDPIFVLHGGPGLEADYFLPFLDELEAQARLIYIDQPGHGLSERTPFNLKYTMQGAVDAVEGLREAMGLETITLLGHSYGGFISQLYAAQYPERVARLILVDTAPSWDWTFEAIANIARYGTADQRNLPRGLSEDERLRIMFPLYFSPQDQALADVFLDRVILSPGPWIDLPKTAAFRFFDMSEELANITAPALILVGEDDLITTPNQARKLADLLPNARMHVFSNTGHNPFVEETADFNRIIGEFLAETR